MKPSNLKICAELTCNHIYVPDNREGLCPRCGSEGIWLSYLTEENKNESKTTERCDNR